MHCSYRIWISPKNCWDLNLEGQASICKLPAIKNKKKLDSVEIGIKYSRKMVHKIQITKKKIKIKVLHLHDLWTMLRFFSPWELELMVKYFRTLPTQYHIEKSARSCCMLATYIMMLLTAWAFALSQYTFSGGIIFFFVEANDGSNPLWHRELKSIVQALLLEREICEIYSIYNNGKNEYLKRNNRNECSGYGWMVKKETKITVKTPIVKNRTIIKAEEP